MCIRDSSAADKEKMFAPYEQYGMTYDAVKDEPVSYTHLDVYKRQVLVVVREG